MRPHGITRRGLTVLVAAVLIGGLAALPAAADPPGNNGTVKIDGLAFDDQPNNQPHPGCLFQVDFYGFDEGDLVADVHFNAHPPSGRTVLLEDYVFIGEDPAGGGTDLDASRTYDLSPFLVGLYRHPKQGYHVKLTVHAEGSQGADTKHKVFWVDCDAPGDGTIIIEKYALPAGDTVFRFDGDLGYFHIVDEDFGTGNPDSQVTFSNLAAGTYTIFEIPLEGWRYIQAKCTVFPAGGSSTFVEDKPNLAITINLAAGETVYCDFQNSVK